MYRKINEFVVLTTKGQKKGKKASIVFLAIDQNLARYVGWLLCC